jgi:hypothetical protein
MKKSPPLGRLAMRQEGQSWVAYYAQPGTMEGAIWLGAIKLSLVENLERKQKFMDLMMDALSEIITMSAGQKPVWDEPTVAPDSERAGNA